jgi:outer membrane PBP1 activator LpoA protein
LIKNQQVSFWQAGITDVNQGRPSLTLLRALIAQEPLLGHELLSRKTWMPRGWRCPP